MDTSFLFVVFLSLIILSCVYIYCNQQKKEIEKLQFVDVKYVDIINELLIGKNDEILQMDYVLCIGYRGNPSCVHAIKMNDKVITPITPRWGEFPKWSLSKDKKYVIVNDVEIPIEYTRDVTGYCRLSSFQKHIIVSMSEFNEYLRRLQSVLHNIPPKDINLFKKRLYQDKIERLKWELEWELFKSKQEASMKSKE